MDILIEIGNSHQKEQIKKELAVFSQVVDQPNLRVGIIQVVIPSDMDRKVEELQGVPKYRSVRGIGDLPIVTLAKLIEQDDGIIAVLSPLLFTRFPPDAPQLAGGRKAVLRPGIGCDRVGACAP